MLTLDIRIIGVPREDATVITFKDMHLYCFACLVELYFGKKKKHFADN